MNAHGLLARGALVLVLATGVAAQSRAPQQPPQQPTVQPLNAADEVHRQARIAVTGTLGFPPLPPVTADSPRDTIFFADRVPVSDGSPSMASAAEGDGPVMVNGFLAAGPSGTGTAFPEIFKYQLPTSYDSREAPVPLVVAYHGFGGSANSVAASSTIEEECENRGWIYMAPTGIDDQLFGAPISQQNTAAAIQFMVNNFTVDPDRIYMVGFSMGAGITTNFTARRRDPDGLMVAAIGLVSGTYDWTFAHADGGSVLKDWMENPYNFNGPPSTHAFNYQQASGAYFAPSSYPPASFSAEDSLSMGSNLASVPVYMTYDVDDTIDTIPAENDALEALVTSAGGSVTKVVVSGTVDPGSGNPAPHSWAVLDEVALFDFFEGKTAVREPEDFDALQDLGGVVSWAATTQRTTDSFTSLSGAADPLLDTLAATDVVNATELVLDAGEAGVGDVFPLRVDVSSADADGFRLELTGFDETPSYLVYAGTNTVVPLVDSDPYSNSLFVDIAGFGSLSADVIRQPNWTAKLTSDPNPAPQGGVTVVTVDGPDTSSTCFMIVAISEQLYTAKGAKLVALAVAPAKILMFPLNPSGNISLNVNVPVDAALSGLRLPTQVITFNGPLLESVSNLWGFTIE